MKQVFAFAAAVGLCVGSASGAWAQRPEIRLTEEGRASLRSKTGVPSELVSRAELLLLPDDPHFRTIELNEILFRARLDETKRKELRNKLFGHAS